MPVIVLRVLLVQTKSFPRQSHRLLEKNSPDRSGFSCRVRVRFYDFLFGPRASFEAPANATMEEVLDLPKAAMVSWAERILFPVFFVKRRDALIFDLLSV